MTTTQQHVEAFMEENRFEWLEEEQQWYKVLPSSTNSNNIHTGNYVNVELAIFMWRIATRTAEDELRNFLTGGHSIHESSSYSVDRTQLASRLAELDRLVGGKNESSR